jgi:hypothetical protein
MLGIEADDAAEEVIRRQEEAKSKRTQGLKKGPDTAKPNLVENSNEINVHSVPRHAGGRGKHDTIAADVARERNLPRETVEDAVAIRKSDDTELRQQLRSGEESPNSRRKPSRGVPPRDPALRPEEARSNPKFYWNAESLITKAARSLDKYFDELNDLAAQAKHEIDLKPGACDAIIKLIDEKTANYMKVRTAFEFLKKRLIEGGYHS